MTDPDKVREAKGAFRRVRTQLDRADRSDPWIDHGMALADRVEELEAENEKFRAEVNELRNERCLWQTANTAMGHALQAVREAYENDAEYFGWVGHLGGVITQHVLPLTEGT